MCIVSFIKTLNDIPYSEDLTITTCQGFILELSNDKINESEINNYLNDLKEEKWTELDTKLDVCLTYCKRENERAQKINNETYLNKIKTAIIIIEKIKKIFLKKFENKKKAKSDPESTIEQHSEKLEEISKKIGCLDDKVDDATKSIDDKIFTLLINTVAILGIFVAIAFTGFGITAIFPQIDISKALISDENLVKTMFYLLLTSVICYNLLLLLVYLIFRLSRPLFITLRKEKDDTNKDIEVLKNGYFFKTINIKPFIWIDAILSSITIVTFVCIILIW